MPSTIASCRWDWCRSSFPSIDALSSHVKHEHIWPMKPMRKAEIALMRRMDLQSLHSSPNTESGIVSAGPASGDVPSCTTTPPAVPPSPLPQKQPENEFDTFSQLSSPLQTYSPQKLPVSPAFEGLVGQDVHSGLSAAVEMFERTHGRKTSQRPSSHHPLSSSSGSSQEVVEQHLTQEDDVGSQPQPPPLPHSELQIEDELVDTELRWPTDDESNALEAFKEVGNSEYLVSEQSLRLGSSADPIEGLDIDSHSGRPQTSLEAPLDLEGSHSQSQPFVLQTQAPYLSQATGWSQAQ